MKYVLLIAAIFAAMEIISLRAYQNADSQEKAVSNVEVSGTSEIIGSDAVAKKDEEKKVAPPASEETVTSSVPPVSELPSKGMASDSESFPPPSTEVKNGVTERTIHIGVRQWAWDPSTLRAKQGELVRLIIHNADVRHALVIPDLGVEADIPEDGAVVEFMAKQRGTFEFFCSTYCGEGHMEMRGKIVIE